MATQEPSSNESTRRLSRSAPTPTIISTLQDQRSALISPTLSQSPSPNPAPIATSLVQLQNLPANQTPLLDPPPPPPDGSSSSLSLSGSFGMFDSVDSSDVSSEVNLNARAESIGGTPTLSPRVDHRLRQSIFTPPLPTTLTPLPSPPDAGAPQMNTGVGH